MTRQSIENFEDFVIELSELRNSVSADAILHELLRQLATFREGNDIIVLDFDSDLCLDDCSDDLKLLLNQYTRNNADTLVTER